MHGIDRPVEPGQIAVLRLAGRAADDARSVSSRATAARCRPRRRRPGAGCRAPAPGCAARPASVTACSARALPLLGAGEPDLSPPGDQARPCVLSYSPVSVRFLPARSTMATDAAIVAEDRVIEKRDERAVGRDADVADVAAGLVHRLADRELQPIAASRHSARRRNRIRRAASRRPARPRASPAPRRPRATRAPACRRARRRERCAGS